MITMDASFDNVGKPLVMGVIVLDIILLPQEDTVGAGAPLALCFLSARPYMTMHKKFFFTQNRFIIAPVDGYGDPAKTVLERFEASIFLQDVIPTHFIPCLRFLEFVFPPLDEEYISPRCSALDDWDNTIDNIMTKMVHPNLKLRIYFADFHTASHASSLHKNITREEGITKVVTAYMRIVRPLERLKTMDSVSYSCMQLGRGHGPEKDGIHLYGRNTSSKMMYRVLSGGWRKG